MPAKKNPLRSELADAGIIFTGKKPVKRFMHGVRLVDLETCTVRRAMAAALDPNCSILEFKKPAAASKPSKGGEPAEK